MAYAGTAVVALGVAFVSFLFYSLVNQRRAPQQSYESKTRRDPPNNPNTSSNYTPRRWDTTERPDICTICSDELGTVFVTALECSHVFHEVCIRNWKEAATMPTCPICRHRI
ncbi:uncharacterized protein LOC144467951 [Augochlora pura]